MLNQVLVSNDYEYEYNISRYNKCCSWIQMIVPCIALNVNFILLIYITSECNSSSDITDLQICMKGFTKIMVSVIFNIFIQPIIFLHGYNTLRLNCCSSKRIQYIEYKIDKLGNSHILD